MFGINSIPGGGLETTAVVRTTLAVVMALLMLTSSVGVAAAVPSAATTGGDDAMELQTTETADGPETDAAASAAGSPVPETSVSVDASADPPSLGPESAGPVTRQAVEASSGEAALDANTARITGQVFYQDADGNYHPARQVEVTVEDVDLVEKARYDTTRTDDQGRFTLTFDASAPDWGSEASVHVEVYANNPAAEVNPNYVGGWYEIETQKFDIENGETQNMGSIVPAANNPAWEAADYALTAQRRIAEEGDGWNRPKAHIAWPAGDWPVASPFPGFEQIILPDRDVAGWDADTVHHEYGHRVMGTLYENKYMNWPDYSTDGDKCHNIRSDTNEGFAWVEGWAMFTESVVADDPSIHWGDLENTDYYNVDYNGKCYSGDTGYMDGDRAEGSVASILWDLYDGDRHYSGSDDDDLTYSLDTIYRTVDADNVGNVHELWNEFVTDENREELREIYAENGVPKDDGFEGQTPDLDGGDTVDAQITGADTDEFEVDLDDGETLTATADEGAGFADLTVAIETSDGSTVASDAGGAAPSAEWTADGDTTVTVVVEDTSPSSSEYTLSVDVAEPTVRIPDWTYDAFDDYVFVDSDLWQFEFPSLGDDGADANCDHDATEFEGTVSADPDADHKIGEAFQAGVVDGDCPVRVELVGADASADLDLFVTLDGRTPSATDYDLNSITAAANESIVIPADELDDDTVISATARAYTGESEFTLVVEPVDDD